MSGDGREEIEYKWVGRERGSEGKRATDGVSDIFHFWQQKRWRTGYWSPPGVVWRGLAGLAGALLEVSEKGHT